MSFKVDDPVTPNIDAGYPESMRGQIFKIISVPRGANGVNYKAVPCSADGSVLRGPGLRGPEFALLPYDSTASAIVEPYVPNPAFGTAVRCKTPIKGNRPDQVYVVLGDVDHHRVRVTMLGNGNGSTYWRLPSSTLTVLDGEAVQNAVRGL